MATDARSGLWREDEELLPVVSGRRVRNAFGGQATGEDGRGRRLRCGGGMASVLRRLYLSVYNWIVFIGWVQVSWSMILALLEKRYEAVYAAVEQHLLFAQTAAIMEIHTHIFVTSLLISWCITEVTRYSFNGMKESFGFTPSWLLWLRYSTFIVCFPIGMVSEVGLVYIVVPFMKLQLRLLPLLEQRSKNVLEWKCRTTQTIFSLGK
uniref:Very-long-chain (3R)-3-hydroxyacyl-CoA dehydratase n=1 Tax=Oryza rufipogon TaxID=4529 RepID=A0A0E0MRD8_ORYRU